uniref:Uncharacterized protein n=1 Tax=Salix viminalis TaxID=40686 RepID=A0A6N2JYF9_SALVM
MLLGLEHGTRAVAPSRDLQLIRALSNDVRRAFDHTATTCRGRAEFHRNVKAIDVRDINEILVCKLADCVFGEGVRGRTIALAS